MSASHKVHKRGSLPEAEGLAYLVKLNVDDFHLTGALGGDVVYQNDNSEDGQFVTLKTFSRTGAAEWLNRLKVLGCAVELRTIEAPKHTYVVRAKNDSTGKYSIHVVEDIPGWGAEHRFAVAIVEQRTGLRATICMQLEGVRYQAGNYVRSPLNQALDPKRHSRHAFRDWAEIVPVES